MSISHGRPRAWPTARRKRIVGSDAFDRLDVEWVSLCRRHRRSGVVARWARSVPELAGVRQLAEVIPPPGVDRTPRFLALHELTADGDRLAARALLQLLAPGLVRLAASLGTGDAIPAAVVSTAWLYIERIRAQDLRCRAPEFLLRSVRRDLLYTPKRRRPPEVPVGFAPATALSGDDCPERPTALGSRFYVTGRGELGSRSRGDIVVPLPRYPSAEDVAWTERLAVSDAVATAGLSPLAAEIVHEAALGRRDVATVARDTGTPYATAYRLRDRAYAALRDALDEAS